MRAELALLVFMCVPINSWATEKLIMLTWADYIDPSIVSGFEEQYDAQIIFEYFDSTEDLGKRLSKAGNNLHDVVVIDGSDINHYIKLGWLESITQHEVTNIIHLDQNLLSLFGNPNSYSVPYFWGTLGIAYREDLVPTPPTSWLDLFRPDTKIGKRIGMIDDGRDLFGMALKALGYSANSTEFEAILKAEDLIYSQSQSVYTYHYSELNNDALLVSGDVVMSVLYNGDALTLQQLEPSINFFIPPEGGNLWVDYLTILSGAPNKKLAKEFINYLNKPEIAAKNAEYLYFATPNKEALKHTSEKYKNNNIIFPSDDVLKSSETYKDLPPRILRKINNITASLPEI
jgi:spermidine/putrescine transport system substrate-binding protein